MIKKTALLALIIAPFGVFIYLTGDFMAHYNYLVNVYFKGMEHSYSLGCLETQCMGAGICESRAQKLTQELKSSTDKVKSN